LINAVNKPIGRDAQLAEQQYKKQDMIYASDCPGFRCVTRVHQ